MARLEPHPACDALPRLDASEFARLVEDVRCHGLLHPIVTFQGTILDGRHRYQACLVAKIEPRFVEWEPKHGESAIDYVISTNAVRRHLSASQRAALAAELEPMYAGEAKERQSHAKEGSGKRAREQAAKATGASGRHVQRAKSIRERDPETFAKVKAGDITIGEASRVLKAPPPRGGGNAEATNGAESGTAKIESAPPVDALGRSLPTEEAVAAFQDNTLREIYNELGRVVAQVNKFVGPAARELRSSALTDLRSARAAVRFAMPHAACPYWPQCQVGCKACQGTGWITRAQWNNVPKELRSA